MTGVDTRSVARNSLFLLADLRLEQQADTCRVRVRNLSDGGMMAEGSVKVMRGHRVEVQLRNIGTVTGIVAWVQDDRFGIAFDQEIDSQKARRPAPSDDLPPAMMLGRSWAHRAPPPPELSKLRKI